VRVHPILAFPLVYIGWAYLFWTPLLFSEESVWTFPNILLFLIGGSNPLIASLGLAVFTGGKAQILDLAKRLIDLRRIPATWWLVILTFWLGFDLMMAGLAVSIGITDLPLNAHWSLFSNPDMLLFLTLLSFVFPAIEEVGLRGYYLDTIQQRFCPTTAGLINGTVWAIWHVPFVWFPGYYSRIISELVVVEKGKIVSHRSKQNGHPVPLKGIDFFAQEKTYPKEACDVRAHHSTIFPVSSNQNCRPDCFG
jgi:hypothetical protein